MADYTLVEMRNQGRLWQEEASLQMRTSITIRSLSQTGPPHLDRTSHGAAPKVVRLVFANMRGDQSFTGGAQKGATRQ